MAYFSNGTEGMAYQAAYCDKCWHDRESNCPVWGLHLAYSPKQSAQPIVCEMLSELIPEKDGVAQKCTMFVPLDKIK